MNKKIDYLRAIYHLGYASSETIAVETDIPNGNKMVKRMEDDGYIIAVRQYGGTEAEKRRPDRKIYTITAKGRDWLGVDKLEPIKEKSLRDIYHQIQIVNVIMGIYWPIRNDWTMRVKHNREFDLTDGTKYRCDAHIRLERLIDGKVKDIILEVERTKAISMILKEKISKNELMKKFSEYGLSKDTHILYIKSTQYTETTPLEARNAAEDRLFKDLQSRVKHLGYHYLFARYQDWKKPVFYLPNGDRKNLIN